MKTTIENLNATLEKASNSETDLRNEIAALQRSLMESNSNASASNEKLKQLQKNLTNSENEKRILAERLEATQQNLTDIRRSQQALQDQVQRLQTELANNEVQRSSLEAQLRHATSMSATYLGADSSGLPPGGGQDDELIRQLQAAQREKMELRGKMDSLSDKIRQLEAEKRSLERSVAKAAAARSKSFERPEKGSTGDNGNVAQLEQENRDLRLKIRRLEAQVNIKKKILIISPWQ